MKEFLEELKWACTESKLKVFYLAVTVLWVFLMLGCAGSLVMIILNLVLYKAFKVMWLGLFLVSLLVSIGIFIFLKKS